MSQNKRKSAEGPYRVFWVLKLYVAGQSPKSITAFANLKKICDDYLGDSCSIEVVDLLKNPKLAKGEQIVAIPTLVKLLPPPVRRLVGNLANTEKTLIGLDLKAASRKSGPK